MLCGVVVGTQLGASATVLYLGVYLMMNIAAFAVIIAQERDSGDDLLGSIAGLGARNPWLAWPLTIAMLALAGIPGTVGFVGKFQLIHALVNGDYTWLAIVLVIGAMISLGYYLRVVAAIWMGERSLITLRPREVALAPIAGGAPEADEDDEPEAGEVDEPEADGTTSQRPVRSRRRTGRSTLARTRRRNRDDRFRCSSSAGPAPGAHRSGGRIRRARACSSASSRSRCSSSRRTPARRSPASSSGLRRFEAGNRQPGEGRGSRDSTDRRRLAIFVAYRRIRPSLSRPARGSDDRGSRPRWGLPLRLGWNLAPARTQTLRQAGLRPCARSEPRSRRRGARSPGTAAAPRRASPRRPDRTPIAAPPRPPARCASRSRAGACARWRSTGCQCSARSAPAGEALT